MTKRLCSSEIWTKDWFLELTIKQKLLVKFLYDNCDCAGIYEISYHILNMCFQEKITIDDFKGLKQIRIINDKIIYLEDFIKFQYNIEISELNPRNNVHKGILRKLNKYNIVIDNSDGETIDNDIDTSDESLPQSEEQILEEVQNELISETNLNTSNEAPDNSTITNEVDEPEEVKTDKIDPLYDKRVSDFITEFKKYFNFINTAQNRKLIAEVVSDETLETWKQVFEKSHNKGHLIDGTFRPLSLKNLLKNYTKILEGTYQLVTNPKMLEMKKLEEYRNKIKNLELSDEMPASFKALGKKLKQNLSKNY